MIDEKKNTLSDDEYQFPKDEYASSAPKIEADLDTSAEAAAPSRGALLDRFNNLSLRNKRIIAVILIAALLMIIFHFLNSKKVPVVTSQPVVQQVTQPAQPTEQPMPSDDSQMTGSLEALGTRVKELRANMSDMQNNFTALQTTNQQLQQAISALTAQVQALETQLNALSAVKAPVKKHTIVFHLRAVLPDRAWITSNSGETISVTVGDKIEQYGTVQSIDDKRGVINTSSGRKIGYGPNDY